MATSEVSTNFTYDPRPRNGLAHVIGDIGPELWSRTIPATLKATVKAEGGREAVLFVEQGVRWTWSEFAEEVDALAAGILGLGLKKGDRVGIWSPNRYEWLLTQFATARLGVILVTINPAYRVAEVEYVLNKVSCVALVTATDFKASDYVGMLRSLAPELSASEAGALRAERLPHLKSIIKMGDETERGFFRFADVLENGRGAEPAGLDAISAKLMPDDPINIQFTSGTTGAPKGATLTHANIVNNGRFVAAAQNFTNRDRLCIPVPLYHCFAMVLGTLGCVSTGTTMLFPSEGFDPDLVLKSASDEQCTAIYGVPTMFVAMLEHSEFAQFDLSAMRTGVMAGAPCPIEVMKRCVAEMNLSEMTIAYGMTETSPVSFQTSAEDPLERRVTTVGRIHPHVECKVIDAVGATVLPGVQGELCTRGYSVMKGYWEDDERTAEVIDSEGWMHTGDLATIDDEGYCNITGRVNDMVIRGGENVYPREIEESLYGHPSVQEVQVFGIPDKRLGEEVCAWVVLKNGESVTESDIKEFCRGQMAHYKVPRYVRFKDHLPLTVTGKAQKFKMRDVMMEELGLQAERTA
ncbi:MAG: AMP-binding protein [Rhodospirillaceae bacterium]|nr:AMP-binding protein [Rhodospirillaceae bacterium]